MGLPDDLAMPFLLMATFRGLVDAVHSELSAAGFAGVRARHGFAMQAVGEGCTSVELGQRLGVSKQAAAKTARDLEGMGFIERRGHPTDGRAVLLTPTPRGRQMLDLSARAFREQVQEWRRVAGDDRVDATLHTLALVDHGPRGQHDLSDWVGDF